MPNQSSFLQAFIRMAMLAAFSALLSPSAMSQITEKPIHGRIAIENVEIHPVTGDVIPAGVVLIEGDRIGYVGTNVKADLDAYHRIDGSGLRLYPGFIDTRTGLGLVEISAVPVTVDDAEVGSVNPEMLAFSAINPHSAAIPVTRVEGVTNVVAVPTGGIVSGKATLIDLWGYSPDSMAVLPEAALVMNFPSGMKWGAWDTRTDKEILEQFSKQRDELDELFKKAEFYDGMMDAYESSGNALPRPDRDPKMEAMRAVVDGSQPIILNVDREKDILNALEWIGTKPGYRFILSGVSEGWRVADRIAAAGVPVIVQTLYTPTRSYDNYQRPYQNPGLLHQAGVTVLISSFNTENTRNLMFNAGYAATYGAEFGFGSEEAIQAITINAARAFGLEDRLGSIEEGKQANLVLVDGDPLETTTKVKQVIIRGRAIPMVSRHTQLHEEFLDRDSVLDGSR